MTVLQLAGLAATVSGDGPTLVFLHGIGSSRRAFDPQIDGLADRYTCVAIDALGYGDSEDPTDEELGALDAMDVFAQRVEDALDELGPGEALTLVGVSFGGVVAQRIALRARTRIDALVLADTSFGSGVDPDKAAAMRARSDERAALGDEAFAHARAPRLVSPAAPPALVERIATMMARDTRQPGYGLAAEAMAGTDHRGVLGALHQPTLVVVGEADVVCPPETAAALVTELPHGHLQEIPGAGHLANLERPDEFNAAVDAFVRTFRDQFDRSRR